MSTDYDETEMAAAITAGVEALTTFMNEQGFEMRRRLGALGDRAVVTFGSKKGGGFYTAVFLHQRGILSESKSGRVTDAPVPATPQQAVEAFARHGAGWKNPTLVRNIVEWVTERIELLERSR